MADNPLTQTRHSLQAKASHTSVKVRRDFLELGMPIEEVQRQVDLWLAISLFKQAKITSTQAGDLLGIGRDAFLDALDQLGIIYVDALGGRGKEIRTTPTVTQLAEDRTALASLNEELSRANRCLRQANERIRETDRLKSEFVATISHELLTPLNTILGFAKFMLNGKTGPLNDTQRTNLTAIYSSGQELLGLVNNILDLSMIEAGKITLHKELLDFHEIVVGVMSSAIALIDDKPVRLKEEIAPDLPRVYADRQRVRQIISNLISNAAKFTRQGHIILRAKHIIENGQSFILCTIEDTGIGIRRADIPIIFEAFRQIDGSPRRRAQGTGLGLPISRMLAEIHGGRMWVESELGVGSRFHFTLPVGDDTQLFSQRN